jgi:sulfite reductase alpha subunit-like flavoprotein
MSATEIEQSQVMEYATDLDSFLAKRPQEHAVINNIDEKGDVPSNTYKPKDPYVGKVIFNETLTGPDAGEVCHIAFDHAGNLPYAEGQSIGIVAKGT